LAARLDVWAILCVSERESNDRMNRWELWDSPSLFPVLAAIFFGPLYPYSATTLFQGGGIKWNWGKGLGLECLWVYNLVIHPLPLFLPDPNSLKAKNWLVHGQDF